MSVTVSCAAVSRIRRTTRRAVSAETGEATPRSDGGPCFRPFFFDPGSPATACLRPHQPDKHRPVGLVVAGKQADIEGRQVADDDQPRRDLMFDAKQQAGVDGSRDRACRLAPLQAMQEGACQAVHRRASRFAEAASSPM